MSYDTIYLKLDQTFINALTPQSLRVGVTSTFTAGKLYQLNVGGEIFMAKLQIIG